MSISVRPTALAHSSLSPCIEEEQSIEAVLCHMREAGVRRVPVVDRSGALSGVLSIDDVLERIAENLLNIAGSIRNEQRMERAVRQ